MKMRRCEDEPCAQTLSGTKLFFALSDIYFTLVGCALLCFAKIAFVGNKKIANCECGLTLAKNVMKKIAYLFFEAFVVALKNAIYLYQYFGKKEFIFSSEC